MVGDLRYQKSCFADGKREGLLGRVAPDREAGGAREQGQDKAEETMNNSSLAPQNVGSDPAWVENRSNRRGNPEISRGKFVCYAWRYLNV